MTEYLRTCYYCYSKPIGRWNDVPVCVEHGPKKIEPVKETTIIEAKGPDTPRIGSLFGTTNFDDWTT